MSHAPKFLAVDFFSGAGGTTRGLLDAGGYVIAGIDIDELCEETYTRNNRNTTLDKEKARFLNYDIFPKTGEYPAGQQGKLIAELKELIAEYREMAGEHVPLCFAICAPCQPFTGLARGGMTEETQEKRLRDSGLLHEAYKFVKRFDPDIVLSENVSGISGTRYGTVWENFRRKLKRRGYATGAEVVCTSNFGIPQKRRRAILLAAKGDHLKGDIEVPTENPGASPRTVSQAIGHLPAIEAGETHAKIKNHRARNLSKLNWMRLSEAPPGSNNSYLHNTKYGDLSLACHRRANAKHKSRCFSNVYTRMHPDKPSPTITTKCHSISNGGYGHYDPEQVRAISLREAATLQSFRQNYVFYDYGSLSVGGRMIGNAVPPKLVKFYAKYLVGLIHTP